MVPFLIAWWSDLHCCKVQFYESIKLKFHVSTVQLSLSLRPAKDGVSRSISVLQEQEQVP